MTLTHNSLPGPEQDSLADWLSKPQFNSLIKVLESKAFVLSLQASDCLLEASVKGAEGMRIRSQNELADAAAIVHAINLLNSVRDQKEPFKVATATP